ncbi:MAG: hypothetical protein ACI39E_04315 [Acutalibacteraceae bacterium]
MKYCVNCGKESPDETVCCPNCGQKMVGQAQPSEGAAAPFVMNTPAAAFQPATKQSTNIMAIIWFIVAGLVLLLCLIGGFMIMGGAGEMATLRSIGGESVAEYFYQYSGAVNKGFALLTIAFGIFGGGLFARFGFKELKK